MTIQKSRAWLWSGFFFSLEGEFQSKVNYKKRGILKIEGKYEGNSGDLDLRQGQDRVFGL